MAWNISNKGEIGGDSKAALGPGAPIAFNPSFAGKPYSDSWDIERAYREGAQKVTWVFRCIDAIAGNQARLPIIFKKENSIEGEIFKGDNPLREILNSKSNPGENSFIFRYRLSAQLLMSTRGVFIEKVFGRDGRIIGLHLLPPQHTKPIPDPKNFVAGFEVDLRNGTKKILKPEDVLWIRRPHPLDPYLSITPMESAGVAIEIENLAKLYNRNYLLNDGRPGGLLVVRGEIDDDDKDELRNRFRGNLSRTGATTVISSDDGVDFVDTSASPRDAAYMQMRQITKEEILSSFGVPESVIGNAAGRTFSNAAEEIRVFWMETMQPHLEQLARAMDELDPKYFIDFDTSHIPILIIAKQERERYLMDEFQQGLISVNEYRFGTGKKKVESELADSLLQNPNQTPIANTEKPFKPEEQVPVDMAGQAGNPNAPAPSGPPGLPIPPVQAPEQAPAEQPAEIGLGETAPQGIETTAAPVPEGALSAFINIETKSADWMYDDWDSKAEQDSDRWVEILDRSLERLFERQQRVVSEKASSSKSRKALASGTLTADSILDIDVWNKQMREDIAPMIKAVINDGVSLSSQKTGMPDEIDEQDVEQATDEQMKRLEKSNATTQAEIAAAILIAAALTDDEERSSMLKAAIAAIFANLLGKRKRMMAEQEAQTAHNFGVYLGGKSMGGASKTWITRRDSRVRSEHIMLHGKTVDVGDGFVVEDTILRFPGDPLAPPNLTINCRCRLRFD